jgi:hypothetical protein
MIRFESDQSTLSSFSKFYQYCAAPRRVGIGAVNLASVVSSMYGDEDDVDGAPVGAAVDFEVFPAEDIQGFMQFPEENGQVRI